MMGMRTSGILLPRRFEPTEERIAQCVDFSVPRYRVHEPVNYLVADVSATVCEFMSYNSMLPLYRKFPLHDIIALVMSCSVEDSQKPGYWDFLLFETEGRLGSFINSVDMDNLMVFYEQLQISLDQEIGNKSPRYYASERYVFYQWWDAVSMCLTQESSSFIIEMGRAYE